MRLPVLQRTWKTIALALIALGLSYIDSSLLWLVLFVYGMGIRFVLTKPISAKVRRALSRTIWMTFIGTAALVYYVNHYMPHGPMYSTGDVVCMNDGRGPCKEQFKEDLRGLKIPHWSKFLRTSGGGLLIFGLLFAGIVTSSKSTDDQ